MFRIGLAALALLCAAAWLGFAAPARASSYQVLYSFQNGSDGRVPDADLIEVGGKLYGTTFYGGGASRCNNGGCGTVFALDLQTGAEKVVFTSGYITPTGSLIYVGGLLYGVGNTYEAGPTGLVFSLDPKTGTFTTLHEFNGGTDGSYPNGGLIDVDGTLYGTTNGGGRHSNGTVFSLNRRTGTEKIVYAFKPGGDGAFPLAGLIDVDGTLYGTTSRGGTYRQGTVFSLDLQTGAEKLLHSFQGGTDGSEPQAGLIDVDGILYGMATNHHLADRRCPSKTCGTVFSLNPATGTETVLHRFPSEGGFSFGGLTGVADTLKGTTFTGGAGGSGTVFSLRLTTHFKKDLYSFQNGTDGGYPRAGLTKVGGILYGTTSDGGTQGNGTVFAITP